MSALFCNMTREHFTSDAATIQTFADSLVRHKYLSNDPQPQTDFTDMSRLMRHALHNSKCLLALNAIRGGCTYFFQSTLATKRLYRNTSNATHDVPRLKTLQQTWRI